MGLYTEEQQQEFIVSMRKTARATLDQLLQVAKLARFGADDESLRALDRFADGYRAEGVVNDKVPRALGFAAPAPGPLDKKQAMLQQIKNNAAAVVKMFSPPGQSAAFGLTAQSIAALDEYIGRTVYFADFIPRVIKASG